MNVDRRSDGDIDYLAIDDQALLGQCDVHIHRASGPGGQHRNKVSSACRLHHRPTGISASAADSRSQQENRRLALRRLRMKIACGVRRHVDAEARDLPAVVTECIFQPKNRRGQPHKRLQIGRRDERFWRVAAYLLDLLEANQGRVSSAAEALGITTSNLIGVMKSDRHLLAAAQDIRKAHGRGPLK